MAFLNEAGLTRLWNNIVNRLGTKVDKVEGKGLSTNDYTTTEKNKLAGIAANAEVNVQSDWNATSGDAFIKNKPTIPTVPASLKNPNKLTIKGAGTSVESYDGSATGEVDIVAGSNVTVTAADGKITIASTDTNTVYTHPAGSAASKSSGLYKFSTDSTSHIKGVTAVTKADITGLGIPAQDTVYDDTELSGKVTTLIGSDSSKSVRTIAGEVVADVIDSAPEAMNTLDELAAALGDDPNFATTVATQIGQKANASDLTSHTSNKSNPHGVTKAQVGLGNVENKSAATIIGEITKANITALGIPAQDTTYSNATTTKSGLMSTTDKVKLDGLSEDPVVIIRY